MRYIALDFGEKRIGVAGSDSGVVITPLEIIKVDQTTDTIMQVGSALKKYAPQEIIVGLPLARDGSLTQSAHAAHAFGTHLARRYPLWTLHFINEILTTFEARQRSGRKTGEAVDDHAAAVILEQFITEQKKND